MGMFWRAFWSLGVLFWTLSSLVTDAQARARWFRHPTLRLVVPEERGGKLLLWWQVPSGSWVRFSVRKDSHSGWVVRLRRFMKKGLQPLAVGGKFFLQSKGHGWVRLHFVRRVRRVYRGVRVVKFDGQMPIFLASVLPRYRGDRLRVYKLWGRVNSNMNLKKNRLLCVYGTWFDFSHRELGVVYQSNGLKGGLLRSFSSSFHFPRKWSKIWKRRARLLRYQKRQRLQKKVAKPSFLPVISTKEQQLFLEICKKRLNQGERKATSWLDPLHTRGPSLASRGTLLYPFAVSLSSLPPTMRFFAHLIPPVTFPPARDR